MPYIYTYISLVLAIVITMTPAHAARTVKSLDNITGLSNSYIVSITQDADGYIWIATEDGLNKFDGSRFVNFNKRNSGLSADELNCVTFNPADPDRLWIATQRDGVCVYDNASGKIEPLKSSPLISPDVTTIVPAADGGLWMVHYHYGVQYYNHATNTSRRYDFTTIDGLPRHTWTVEESHNGNLYVGHAEEGFSIIYPARMTAKNFRHSAGKDGLPGNSVYAIAEDSQGQVWLGTENGAALFNPTTESFIQFVHNPDNSQSIAPGRISSIQLFDNGEVWFATSQGGVSILDTKSYAYSDITKAKFTTLPVNGESGGTTSSYIRTIFKDSYGNIWLGNFRAGLDVINHIQPTFTRLDYLYSGTHKLTYRPTWSCAAIPGSSNEKWIGGDNEIVKIDGSSVARIPLPELPMSKRSYVRALKVAKDKRLWIGTIERGGMIYDPKTGRFTLLDSDIHDIRTFFEDDGKMLLGTVNGMYAHDGHRLQRLDEINSQLKDLVVQDIERDANGNLWVGTFGKGIYIFDRDNKLKGHHEVTTGFPSNAINAIMSDTRGRMWLATRAGAVMFNNPQDLNSYVVLDDISALGVTHVKGIEEDLSGNFWMSTNKGIVYVDKDLTKTILYENPDYQPISSFIVNASMTDDAGSVYFASNNGVLAIDPSSLDTPLPAGPVKVTNFTVYHESGNNQENETSLHISTDKITLPYNSNTFRITFNILDYALAQHTDLAYNLHGLDDVWIETHGDNNAMYRNLAAGTYQFKVKQRHKGDKWGEATTIMTITIKPPLWLTWWAKSLYVIVGLGLIILTAYFYKRRVDIKQKLDAEVANSNNQQKLNEERLRFYTNITHELRTPLTLIMGPLEDLVSDPSLPKQYSYKLQMIRDSSTSLLNLINDILEFRKTETQNRQLMVKRGNLANQIREIGLRYKELNRNPDVTFVLDIEDKSPELYYDADMIGTILNNLLSNAMKYTRSGSITISYGTVLENGIKQSVIKVADTGFGISKDGLAHIFERYYQVHSDNQASGTGIGLALVKNLADIHQAQLDVQSVEGEGSTFTLSLLTDNLYPDAIHGEKAKVVLNTASQSTEDLSPSGERLKVLVVEDNDDIREYISQALSDEFHVITARNGLEGLKMVQEQNPDLVISDIMMPEMDGIALCKCIKEDILTSHIPVILLTAKDSLRDREDGYDAGADSYLTKPFSAKLLVSRIHSIQRMRRRIASRLMGQQPADNADATPSGDANGKHDDVTSELNPIDKQFMDKIYTIINDNMALDTLGVAFIADKMCMSSSTLYRKIMAIVGVSTNEYIRHIRLTRAAEMLLEGSMSITDISFSTGFGSHSSFAKAFKKEFGMTASEYVSNHNKTQHT